MRMSAQHPVVKSCFYLRWLLPDDRSTGFAPTITRIADAAVRGGLVIYSIDARGLVGMVDASSNRADPKGSFLDVKRR